MISVNFVVNFSEQFLSKKAFPDIQKIAFAKAAA